MLEHPVITQMERYGEMGVRRNVGATTGRPRAIDDRPYKRDEGADDGKEEAIYVLLVVL